jgi:hypothetical protein
MRMRRTAVAALLAAGIVVPTMATAAAAVAQPAAHPAAAQRAKDKVAVKPGKTRKPVRTPFAASGRVTAVDAAAGTVTLLAQGGSKDVRKRTVTVAVPSTARVVINGKRGALSAVTVGARITVNGTRSAGVYTASKVQVSQKAGPVVTPSPKPTVQPTPTVEPTEPTPDDGDTEEPADEISDDLSA